VLAQLHEKYPQDVRLIFRHFPLSFHANSLLMAYASEAAARQGKFFEMEAAIYAGQADWSGLDGPKAEAWLEVPAQKLGLDLAKFKTDLHSPAVQQHVIKDQAEGEQIQIPQTPFLIVNGIPYLPTSGYDLASLSSLVELSKRQYSACPSMSIDPAKHYQATLKTAKGDIVIELFADRAPHAVNSFAFLAGQKWYDGVPFYTVIPGFAALTGDPTASGYGTPGYAYPAENTTAKFDQPGQVGMLNFGSGTNGSQFFITLAAAPNLDGKFTPFGQVTQGMEVVKQLTPRDPSKGEGQPAADQVLSVTVQAK
jgi:cyclophilin family peptidyl-prolyl cis-trans isomerase